MKQGLLFDVDVQKKAPSTMNMLTHRVDPDTSRQGAEHLRRSGKRAYHWWIILGVQGVGHLQVQYRFENDHRASMDLRYGDRGDLRG